MPITGTAVKYGDDISTDLIFPGRYTYIPMSEKDMAQHALEDLDQSFAGKDMEGRILVVGRNFGCGSAREQAVKCLKQKKITAIVAKSFSRIYFRNCINEGLLPITCPDAVDEISEGEEISLEIENGILKTRNGTFTFGKFSEYVRKILDDGGLIPNVRKELGITK